MIRAIFCLDTLTLLAFLAMLALGLWMIWRGIRPNRWPRAQHPSYFRDYRAPPPWRRR